MNTTLKAALAATLVIGTASAARADLTTDGAVGLVLNPTAQRADAGTVRVQGGYYHGDDNDGKFYSLGAAGSIAENFEVSGALQRADNGQDENGVALGAKYVFPLRTGAVGARNANVAVGVGYSKVRLENIYGYAVGTVAFGTGADATGRVPATGHLGLRYNNYNDVIGDDNMVQVYGGVEIPFTRTGDWSAVAEAGSKPINGGDAQFALGVRYRPAGQAFSVGAGVVRQGFHDDTNFFITAGYNFSGLGAGGGQ